MGYPKASKIIDDKTVLAYAAGFLDGEGCIEIRPRDQSSRKKGQFYLRITIAGIHEPTIRWIKDTFGGHVNYRPSQNKKWKPVWAWVASSHEAKIFLEQLLPYIKIKKPQALLAIELASRIQYPNGRGKAGMSEDEREVRCRLYEAMKLMKSGDQE